MAPTARLCAASLLAALVALAGCRGDSTPAAEDAAVGGQTDAGVDGAPDASSLVEIVVFHTTDEHGWLQPVVSNGYVVGGVANVYSWLTTRWGYDPTRHLLISGGDCWTGAAISTWFEGEPVVDAMNLMGYRAQTLGNHEFDFGQGVLRARGAQADYPLLGANVKFAATGEQVDFALPYTMTTVDGVAVGIIGLATPSTSTSANPALVADLAFAPLYETLVTVVPEVRAAGADVVLVVAHAPFPDVAALAETLPEPVDALFAGHSHGTGAEMRGGVPVVISGTEWRSYSVVTLTWSREARAVIAARFDQDTVYYPDGTANPVTPDPALAALVATWQARTDEALAEVLGYTATGIGLGTWAQANWVVDSWRWAIPAADIAITNVGGIRQSVPAGDVTLEDVVNVLPFDNRIYGVNLTGAQVIAEVGAAVAACGLWGACSPAVSGMTYSGAGSGVQITLAGGGLIDPQATYHVLVNDYMYNGGNGYRFKEYDPEPVDYGGNYRDPVVSWTRQLATSASDPLEAHLDPAPRGQ
jgi:2',3'-cyclic-nucleotide 2'-phosphodiesterase (5'-nucleotidase family)